jgi:AcrR family transcriptional regulator
MAPPRKHDSDRILDAARTIALRDGPRATSVAAIAEESGAPAGTLYHRFGNRDRILQEAWLRALGRFHTEVLGAAGERFGAAASDAVPADESPREERPAGTEADATPGATPGAGTEADATPGAGATPGAPAEAGDAVEAGVAMAAAAIRFARGSLDDARLLAVVRRRDLLDGGAEPAFEARLAAMNAPVEAALAGIAGALGHTGPRASEVVIAAVVDLPGGAIRRHARDDAPMPGWLEDVVAANARRLLTPDR